MNLFFEKVYSSPKRRLFFSFLLAAIFFIIVYNSTYITYTTADDENAINAIAGYKTGNISIAVYLNYFLSLFIGYLYKIFPFLPVYSLLQVFFLFVSIGIIFYTVFCECYRKGYSFQFALFLNMILFLTQYWYVCVRMHFRTTATLIGIASIACIYLSLSQSYRRGIKFALYICSVVFLSFCFLYAKDNGYLVCCYLLLVLLLALIQNYGKTDWKKQLLIIISYCITMTILISALITNGRTMMNEWNGDEYAEYNKYRISYQDYGTASYEENEETYRLLGWSENFFYLTKSLYYMDEKFNTENLSKIVQKFSWNSIDFEKNDYSMRDDMAKFKNSTQGFFRTDYIPLVLLCIYLGVAIIICYLLLEAEKSSMNLFVGLLTAAGVLGTFLIYAYLCIKGRMILRAYQSFMLPAIFAITLLGLNIKYSCSNNIKKMRTALFILTSMGLWLTINTIYSPDVKADFMHRQAVNYELEKYAIAHKQNFYILNNQVGNSFYPFDVKEKGALDNICHWGGGPMGTGIYQEQLKAFGIDELSISSFFEDNVYLIVGYPAENGLYYLINYLNEEYHELITFEVIKDDNELFVVLKAKKNSIPEDGWINFGDYNYYMEDGEPKIGEFNIDGIEYYGEEETTGAQFIIDSTGQGFYIPQYGLISTVH